MGVTVRQKRPGRGRPWHVFVHHNGLIRSRKVGPKREAEAIAAAVRKKLAAGELRLDAPADRGEMPTFGDYARRYIDGYAKTACKRSTWDGYERILANHLLPAWANRRLDQITRADVKRLLLAKHQAGLKGGTVANIRNLISGIFTHAYEDEILTANPALRMGKYIPKSDRKQHVRPLTREQAAAFLKAAHQHCPEHHALLLCAFRTGMRMGELFGLAWEDIDFDANTIHVRRGFVHEHWTSPKSRRTRQVDMSDQLKRTLTDHHAALLRRFRGKLPAVNVAAVGGGPAIIRLVFPSGSGGPLDGNNFRSRVFHPLIAKADVPAIRFHDIRHTFASLLLTQGESLHYVKEQMGHASIQTTVDVYGHLVPGSNRNAVNRLDDDDKPKLRLTRGKAS